MELRGAFAGSVVAALCVALVGTAARADDDERTARWAEAAALEAAGAFAEALDTLDELASLHPQDYALQLRLGWLAFQAERYPRAARYYDRAAELSGGSFEARLGQAWTALRRGAVVDARRRFTALADERPGDERVADGLAAAAEAHTGWIAASARALGYGYPGHPLDEWGLGFSVGVGGGFRHLVAGASYRYGRFSYLEPPTLPAADGATSAGDPGTPAGPGPGGGPGAGATTRAEADEHQLYLHAGVAWERVGVTGHYAWLSGSDGSSGAGHVGGVVGRVSPRGDLTAELSYAGFADARVFRAALGWRLPVVGPLSLRPHGALQVVDGDVVAGARGSGGLAVGIEDERGAIWLGGRGGRAWRPVQLGTPVAYVVDGTILGAAGIDGRVRLAPGWSLIGGVELYRASISVTRGEGVGTGHFGLAGSLGVTFEH